MGHPQICDNSGNIHAIEASNAMKLLASGGKSRKNRTVGRSNGEADRPELGVYLEIDDEELYRSGGYGLDDDDDGCAGGSAWQ
jgi:hypothetical protein